MQRGANKFRSLMVLFLMTSATLVSCDRHEIKRQYVETWLSVSKPSVATHSEDPHAGVDISQFRLDVNGEIVPADESSLNKGRTLSKGSGRESLPVEPPEITMTWTLPINWVAVPGSGMRLGTFIHGSGDRRVEVAVTSLNAAGWGGLEANVQRWMRQIGLQAASSQALNIFLEDLPNWSLPQEVQAQVIDFTTWQPPLADEASAMIVALIETAGKQIFVKMTGSVAMLKEQRQAFQDLCLSLTFQE